MSSEQAILDALNRIRTAMQEKHDDLLKIIDVSRTATIAEIDALRDVMSSKFNQVFTRLNHANGTITDHEKQLKNLEIQLIEHPVNCPAMPKIDSIKDDLQEYTMIKKYPKLAVMLLVVVLALLIVSAYGTFTSIKNNKEVSKIEQEWNTQPHPVGR